MEFTVIKRRSCAVGCTHSSASSSARKGEGSESYEFTQCFHLHSWILQTYYFINRNGRPHPSRSSYCSLVTPSAQTHEDLDKFVLGQDSDSLRLLLTIFVPACKEDVPLGFRVCPALYQENDLLVQTQLLLSTFRGDRERPDFRLITDPRWELWAEYFLGIRRHLSK